MVHFQLQAVARHLSLARHPNLGACGRGVLSGTTPRSLVLNSEHFWITSEIQYSCTTVQLLQYVQQLFGCSFGSATVVCSLT